MKTIALSVDYSWIDQAETTLKSIYAHNQDVKTYIINPDIPHEWFMNINGYLKELSSEVIDLKIDLSRFKDMPNPEDRISKMVYGKFLIPELIKEDKVLYLDSDVIVDQNLDQLFETNIEDRPLYTVVDYFNPDYFNSGVLLINNRFWHNNNIGNQLLDLGRKYNLNNTQVMMNEGFAQNYGKLNPKYNYQIGYESKPPKFSAISQSTQYYLESINVPFILHYVSKDKPFNIVSSHRLREKWWHYHNIEWSKIRYNKKIEKKIFKKEALIFFRFAENHGVEEVIQSFPDIHFNLVAYCNMIFELTRLSQYDNVSVYPRISLSNMKKLIEKIDLCFDLGYGPKNEDIEEVIKFLNIPTLAFTDTQYKNHGERYYVYNSIEDFKKKIKDHVFDMNKRESFTNIFNILVKSVDATLDDIIVNKKSIVRFGDGEFLILAGKNMVYQNFNGKLAHTLHHLIMDNDNPKILSCLPEIFDGLDRYEGDSGGFYALQLFPENYKILSEIEKNNYSYGSAFISRPYMNLRDKSNGEHYFKKIKEIWKDKDVLIVEGNLTRSGIGNDLFAGAKSIKRIICPSKNAYSKINEIETAIRDNADNKLILLMLGPTAKAIVYDLQDLDNQMIDIGHIDSEYEWFKMGAKYKVKIENKHTAEKDFDDHSVGEEKDPIYRKQIITRIQ